MASLRKAAAGLPSKFLDVTASHSRFVTSAAAARVNESLKSSSRRPGDGSLDTRPSDLLQGGGGGKGHQQKPRVKNHSSSASATASNVKDKGAAQALLGAIQRARQKEGLSLQQLERIVANVEAATSKEGGSAITRELIECGAAAALLEEAASIVKRVVASPASATDKHNQLTAVLRLIPRLHAVTGAPALNFRGGSWISRYCSVNSTDATSTKVAAQLQHERHLARLADPTGVGLSMALHDLFTAVCGGGGASSSNSDNAARHSLLGGCDPDALLACAQLLACDMEAPWYVHLLPLLDASVRRDSLQLQSPTRTSSRAFAAASLRLRLLRTLMQRYGRYDGKKLPRKMSALCSVSNSIARLYDAVVLGSADLGVGARLVGPLQGSKRRASAAAVDDDSTTDINQADLHARAREFACAVAAALKQRGVLVPSDTRAEDDGSDGLRIASSEALPVAECAQLLETLVLLPSAVSEDELSQMNNNNGIGNDSDKSGLASSITKKPPSGADLTHTLLAGIDDGPSLPSSSSSSSSSFAAEQGGAAGREGTFPERQAIIALLQHLLDEVTIKPSAAGAATSGSAEVTSPPGTIRSATWPTDALLSIVSCCSVLYERAGNRMRALIGSRLRKSRGATMVQHTAAAAATPSTARAPPFVAATTMVVQTDDGDRINPGNKNIPAGAWLAARLLSEVFTRLSAAGIAPASSETAAADTSSPILSLQRLPLPTLCGFLSVALARCGAGGHVLADKACADACEAALLSAHPSAWATVPTPLIISLLASYAEHAIPSGSSPRYVDAVCALVLLLLKRGGVPPYSGAQLPSAAAATGAARIEHQQPLLFPAAEWADADLSAFARACMLLVRRQEMYFACDVAAGQALTSWADGQSASSRGGGPSTHNASAKGSQPLPMLPPELAAKLQLSAAAAGVRLAGARAPCPLQALFFLRDAVDASTTALALRLRATSSSVTSPVDAAALLPSVSKLLSSYATLTSGTLSAAAAVDALPFGASPAVMRTIAQSVSDLYLAGSSASSSLPPIAVTAVAPAAALVVTQPPAESSSSQLTQRLIGPYSQRYGSGALCASPAAGAAGQQQAETGKHASSNSSSAASDASGLVAALTRLPLQLASWDGTYFARVSRLGRQQDAIVSNGQAPTDKAPSSSSSRTTTSDGSTYVYLTPRRDKRDRSSLLRVLCGVVDSAALVLDQRHAELEAAVASMAAVGGGVPGSSGVTQATAGGAPPFPHYPPPPPSWLRWFNRCIREADAHANIASKYDATLRSSPAKLQLATTTAKQAAGGAGNNSKSSGTGGEPLVWAADDARVRVASSVMPPSLTNGSPRPPQRSDVVKLPVVSPCFDVDAWSTERRLVRLITIARAHNERVYAAAAAAGRAPENGAAAAAISDGVATEPPAAGVASVPVETSTDVPLASGSSLVPAISQSSREGQQQHLMAALHAWELALPSRQVAEIVERWADAQPCRRRGERSVAVYI